MRIGLEFSGAQSLSRLRGIGRYVRHLASALIAADPASEFVVYAHPGEPLEFLPEGPNVRVKLLAPDALRGECTLLDALGRELRDDPERLDVLAVLNPLEMCRTRRLPARPIAGPPVVAVVYDIIPFVFRDRYLDQVIKAQEFYRRLHALRQYDALLAISGATRDDFLSLLNLPPEKVVDISAGTDGGFFTPDPAEPMPEASRAVLDALGIDRPFVMSLGTGDEHKNQTGLIAALGLLPAEVREGLRLVLAGSLGVEHQVLLTDCARRHGVASSLVLTQRIPDEWLRVLYQRCAAFAFPSHYEGFGLPVIEALHCGAPVVAGNNSSLIEAVGDAGLLADSRDPSDLAAKLLRVLTEPDLAANLRRRGPVHASQFTWERTAGRALAVLRRVVSEARGGGPRAPRPRVALFVDRHHESEARGLADALRGAFAVDLYHEPGPTPHFTIGRATDACRDRRRFAACAAQFRYAAVLDPWDQAGADADLARALEPFRDRLLTRDDLGDAPDGPALLERLGGRLRLDVGGASAGPHARANRELCAGTPADPSGDRPW